MAPWPTTGAAWRVALIRSHAKGEGRLPHLKLIGKDPLAIRVHHHNMFTAFPQRRREMQVLSGIDMALWDLAGKLLGQSVATLLGGAFRDDILLYSHCPQGEFTDPIAWRDRAAVVHHAWNIEPAKRHNDARHILIASANAHQPVKEIAARYEFDGVGNNFAAHERILAVRARPQLVCIIK